MSQSLSSPLELWNQSRRMAAVARDVAAGETTFEDAQQQFENWPFTSVAEAEALFAATNGDSRAETTENIQRIIHNRLKSTISFNGAGTPYDQQETLESWNAARSAATAVLTWFSNNGGNDEYTEILHSHRDFLPECSDDLRKVVDGLAGETYQTQHLELSRKLHRGEVTGLANGEEALTSTSGTGGIEEYSLTEEVLGIAGALVRYFIDREHTNYQAVVNQFDGVEFPSRDVVMMNVLNSSGETREDRVRDVGEWVAEWYDDEEAVRELNQQQPRRMGYSAGNSD